MPFEFLSEHFQFLAGAVFGAIAFFVVRHLRKDKVTESLTRKNMLLDLLEKMKAHGIDGEKLEKIEGEFEKQDRIREIEDRLTIESYDFGVAEIHAASTQSEMNDAQKRRLEMLNAKLSAVIHELNTYLDDDGKAKLNAAQKSWEEFRHKESLWSARIWGEGTMAPFVVMGEASRLTIERLAALENQLKLERGAYAREGCL